MFEQFPSMFEQFPSMFDQFPSMFDQFPKTRAPLPKAIADIYSAHYKLKREGGTTASSLAQRMEVWLHKQVAKDVVDSKHLERATLELGAGTLNQLRHEPGVYPYDIVEPFKGLYQGSPLLSRIRNVYSDISDVAASA